MKLNIPFPLADHGRTLIPVMVQLININYLILIEKIDPNRIN